ncbi:hypothetical protein DICVIV_03345 [Dictyocaulus viviparus]|uniref:Uncharacterized protein n=1 Tax=Dictyocaulus viviparus TaxID=29172 RepID=A0A0D8Y1D2_DICVI|nr:hypothetical protein DICVIV_03345 [Dictyocaulus viviparus]
MEYTSIVCLYANHVQKKKSMKVLYLMPHDFV